MYLIEIVNDTKIKHISKFSLVFWPYNTFSFKNEYVYR